VLRLDLLLLLKMFAVLLLHFMLLLLFLLLNFATTVFAFVEEICFLNFGTIIKLFLLLWKRYVLSILVLSLSCFCFCGRDMFSQFWYYY